VPLIRSLTTSPLGGGPDGGTTLGLVLSAAGSGIVLVLVELVVVVVVADELAVEVTAASVAPPCGASWTPAAEELPPHPATAAAIAIRAHVSVIGLRMEVPEGSETA
jgi:hypothetical protein